MDASRHQFGEAEYYQFAVLSDGYSGKVTADQLNSFIDNMVVYQESSRGCRSKLRGAGQYIIDAAKKWNVNEVYLLAHAALESAWGCSSLAQGTVGGYEGFFNFYGIGAYDLDPNNGGAALAKREGWNTVEKALDGAAGWISKNYVNPTVSSAKDSGASEYPLQNEMGFAKGCFAGRRLASICHLDNMASRYSECNVKLLLFFRALNGRYRSTL